MEDYRDDRPRVVSNRTGKVPIDTISEHSLRFAMVTPWVFGVTWLALVALVVVLRLLH